ncbi:hypothetical protein NMG60_11036095 [Bertholletia excelsa]
MLAIKASLHHVIGVCIICGCINFPRRASCFQCNEPRTDDAPPADMASSNPTPMGKKGEQGLHMFWLCVDWIKMQMKKCFAMNFPSMPQLRVFV